MAVIELVSSVAMLVAAVRLGRTTYVNFARGRFDARPSTLDLTVMLMALAASAAVRVWREPDSASAWLLLAFNLIAFPLALIIVQRRRRRESAVSAPGHASAELQSRSGQA